MLLVLCIVCIILVCPKYLHDEEVCGKDEMMPNVTKLHS